MGCARRRMVSSVRIRVRRVARAARRAGLDLHLGDFQVPVAELVPDKVVESCWRRCPGGTRQSPWRPRPRQAPQQRGDPAVGSGWKAKLRRGHCLGVRFRPQSGLAVHQHEAVGVPELVAEVAVALAALAVEVDGATRARAAKVKRSASAPQEGMPSGNSFACSCARWAPARACRPCGAFVEQGSSAMPSIGPPGQSTLPLRTCSSSCPHRAPGRGCRHAPERHLRPVKCVVIMIIRATQKKMMS